MGRELQKKKRRSGRAPVKMSNKPKNPLNPRGNSIIAKNWYGSPDDSSHICLPQNFY
jgi:nucleolar protein 16